MGILFLDPQLTMISPIQLSVVAPFTIEAHFKLEFDKSDEVNWQQKNALHSLKKRINHSKMAEA